MFVDELCINIVMVGCVFVLLIAFYKIIKIMIKM